MPESGARSRLYFGINLLFSSDYFHRTSSGGRLNATNHPAIKPLRRHEKRQTELREKLFFNMEALQYTKQESLSEWQLIVSNATKVATARFLLEYGECGSPFVPYSKSALAACSIAGEVGFAEIAREVSLKTGKEALKFFTGQPTEFFQFKCERVKRLVPARIKFLLIDERKCCENCGSRPPAAILHVDHIIALKNGGTNCISNLQVLCEACNLGKGAM